MANFWDTITSPFKKTAEKAKKSIADFFAPVPDEVRVRDVVRELPGATEKVSKAIVQFGKDVLRAPNRAAASAMLSLQGEKEFIPGTGVAPKLEKFLMGDKPIRDIKGTGEETIEAFGGSKETSAKYGLPLGFALTTLDLIPGIPKKKIAQEVGEQLVKRYGDDVAKLIVQKGGKKLAEKALKEGGEKLVEKAGIKLAKEFDNLSYAKNILKNNTFTKEEISYYRGLTGKNPHGIADDVWEQASKEVGFEPKNLTATADGGQFYMKKTAEEGMKAVRQSHPEAVSTDAIRGGTWFTTPESKTYDFAKEFPNIGGPVKTEASLKIRNPLVVKDAILDDGSFSVINSGYEKFLPKKIADAADGMYTAVRDAEGAEAVSTAIMNGMHDAGIPEKAARAVITSPNKFDVAMDLIISKGLKEKGYDALILENVYKGKVADRHIFKFAEEAAAPAKEIAKASGDLLKKKEALEKLRWANPGDEKIANAIAKLDDQIAKGAEKTAPRNLTSQAEEAIGAINKKGHPVIKEGKKIAPAKARADQLKQVPPTPPKTPNETSFLNAPDSPKGSALEAIDKMVGKTSTPKNVIEWIKGIPKKFTEAFTDRFAPMKRFEEMVSGMAGMPIDINSSAYTAARMYAGRMGTVEAYLGDLQKVLSPLGKQRPDFTRYVLAQRALERAERGFANPTGVSADTARQAITELKAKVGPAIFKSFETAEQAIQKWADDAILKPSVQSGLISKNAYKAIIEKNKHWMPFQVLDYLPDAQATDQLRAGGEIFSVAKQGIVRGLEGTEKIIRDPFEAVIDKLTQATSLIKRNEVAQKLVNLRRVLPEAKELIKPLGKDMKVPKGWGSISVFVDGKATKWAVPEELSWAMHQMNEVEAGVLGNFVKFTSSAFRKGATTLYIPFSLSNAVRDAQMAVMTSKYGFNAADWMRGFANGLKGAFGWESKLLDDFMRNAGGFGGYIQSAREISGVKAKLFEPTWWKRTKAVINPFNLISNFAEAIELAPRLGVYRKAVKAGATGFEAAFEARNATIDFARAGQEMRIINMWVPFVNARWQALLNTARVFKEHPVRSAAKAGALIVTPGVTAYFWNRLNYPDLYDDVPTWVKDTYFTIIVGEEINDRGERVPKMVLIPKGDVGQIFYNPIEYALDYVHKGEPQNFTKLALEWMSQLAPIPFTRDGELSAGQFLSGALPPILRTPIELAANQSFFTGHPIVPRRLESVAPTEQYDEKTPRVAVIAGRALGMSPMKITYGLGGLLGGFGRDAIDPAKMLDNTAKRFYRAVGGEKRNQAWNLKDEATVGYNTAREQAKRAIAGNDQQTAVAIIEQWNVAAEKVLPDILPYLAEDDPQEAQKIRSAITFQPQDVARLNRAVYDEMAAKAEKEGKPLTLQQDRSITEDSLRALRTGGTMSQLFPNQELQQTDLRSIRESLRGR